MRDPVLKGLLGLAAVVAAVVIGAVALVFYSPAPFLLVSHFAAKIGVEIQGVSGSLASGLRVHHMSFGNDENHFTLEDFAFRYTGFWDYFHNNELNITDLSVGRLVLKLKTTHTSAHASTSQAQASSPGAQASAAAAAVGRRLHVARVDISNVELDFSSFEHPFELQNWTVLDFDVSGGRTSFAKFSIHSDAIDLDLANAASVPVASGAGPLNADQNLKIVLKPGYVKLLRAPVSIEGHVKLENGQVDHPSLKLAAFDGKATLAFDAHGRLALGVRDLDVAAFVTMSPPIHHLDLDVVGSSDAGDLSALMVTQGGLDLGGARLTLESGPLVTVSEAGRLVPAATATAQLGAAKVTARLAPPYVALSVDRVMPADDVLARLLFGKPYAALDDGGRALLAGSRAIFMFSSQ